MPNIEVADVFHRFTNQYLNRFSISPEQFKAFNMIKNCRTAKLGGHMEQCGHCGYQRPAYNSCRNRHCPKCQTIAKEKWLNDRRAELLPCGYFHLVFTLPHDINPLVLTNKALLLGVLFGQVSSVLQCFAKDPQWRFEGKLGFLAVLHTWSQSLMDHFHLHCLVPAGVLSADGQHWTKAGKKYLFRSQSLAKAFKHRYIDKLGELHAKNQLQFVGKSASLAEPITFARLIRCLKQKDWIVYAKRPFAGPAQVLEYLGRYTHRVAISNHRILSLTDKHVSFTYRDRSDENKKKHMCLKGTEFIRRFLLHVLPTGFVKIRYFGYMSHRNRKKSIDLIRQLITPTAKAPQKFEETVAQMIQRIMDIDISRCPVCNHRLISAPLGNATPNRARSPTLEQVLV